MSVYYLPLIGFLAGMLIISLGGGGGAVYVGVLTGLCAIACGRHVGVRHLRHVNGRFFYAFVIRAHGLAVGKAAAVRHVDRGVCRPLAYVQIRQAEGEPLSASAGGGN